MFSKFLKTGEREEDYEFYFIEIANIVSISKIQIVEFRICPSFDVLYMYMEYVSL